MRIINEHVDHILFGEGVVVGQEKNSLSIRFANQYGTKQFQYPEAFEEYLKLHNLNLENSVLEELHAKQADIAAARLKKQQEYETAIQSEAEEKLKLKTPKKKTSQKHK